MCRKRYSAYKSLNILVSMQILTKEVWVEPESPYSQKARTWCLCQWSMTHALSSKGSVGARIRQKKKNRILTKVWETVLGYWIRCLERFQQRNTGSGLPIGTITLPTEGGCKGRWLREAAVLWSRKGGNKNTSKVTPSAACVVLLLLLLLFKNLIVPL